MHVIFQDDRRSSSIGSFVEFVFFLFLNPVHFAARGIKKKKKFRFRKNREYHRACCEATLSVPLRNEGDLRFFKRNVVHFSIPYEYAY